MVNLFESMTVWDFMNTFFLFFGCATVLSFHVQAFEPQKRPTASEVTAAVLRLIDHENPEIFRSLKLRFWIWYTDNVAESMSIRVLWEIRFVFPLHNWQESVRQHDRRRVVLTITTLIFYSKATKRQLLHEVPQLKKRDRMYSYIYIYMCGCSLILDNKFFGPSNCMTWIVNWFLQHGVHICTYIFVQHQCNSKTDKHFITTRWKNQVEVFKKIVFTSIIIEKK